jgi:hypothetical protein
MAGFDHVRPALAPLDQTVEDEVELFVAEAEIALVGLARP